MSGMECKTTKILIHGWYNLRPSAIFFDDINKPDFKFSKDKKIITVYWTILKSFQV